MILVCGEALVDLLVGPARSDAQGELPARAIAGGSPFNVAVGLARLGTAVAYMGGIGSDGFAALLMGRLKAERVDTTLVRRSAAPTPLVVVSTAAAGQPAYAFHAHGCADRNLATADLPPKLPDRITALAVGSYALAVEPIGSALLALAEREAGRLAVSLDPNLRPALVGDLAAWRARIERFARCATVIKLSIEDLRAGWGPDTDPAAKATAWREVGVELVVVTHGADGATGYHASGFVHVPGRCVTVADTVGAGDTFHAALLSGLAALGALRPEAIAALDAATIERLLRRAVTAASITCTRRGADLPTLRELDAACS